MKQFFERNRFIVAIAMVFAVALGGVGYQSYTDSAVAFPGAESIGQTSDSNLRALVSSNGTDRVRKIVYFKMEPHATGGANTPVPSNSVCDMAGMLHGAEVKLSGTLAGTAPTLAIKWQNSKDGGTTWTDVGTWTTINATVTPASQVQSVSDIIGSTAVIYGDCWRVTYTMTGTGAAGNFSVTGIEK